MLATEYPTYRIRIVGYFIIILSTTILSQPAESRSQLLQCVRCVVEDIVIVSYTLHGNYILTNKLLSKVTVQ